MSGGILWGEQAAIYGMFTASMVREPKATTSKGGGGGSEVERRLIEESFPETQKGTCLHFRTATIFE